MIQASTGSRRPRRGANGSFSSNRNNGFSRLYTINDRVTRFRRCPDNDPQRRDADIYVSHADGSGVVQLTDTPSRVEFDPAWSPDGSRLVFQGCNPDFINGAAGYCQLYTLDPNGGDETGLSYPAPSIPAADDFNSSPPQYVALDSAE